MKIDIPNPLVREILLNQVTPIWDVPIDMGKIKIKKIITDQILTKYKDKIEWPDISKKELKQAVLDKMAEQAIERRAE